MCVEVAQMPYIRKAGALAATLVLAATCVIGGCRGNSAASGKMDLTEFRPPNIADAPIAYEAAGCGSPKCHGSMTGGGGAAPNLSHEGSRHDVVWISFQINNPKSHNPNSTMPAYDDKKMLFIFRQEVATALAAQK